jgi:uncharacterized Zn-binding protein involved in type VI secretion
MTMAARLGDPTAHGGAIVMGCPTVLIGSMPAARVGDQHVCPMVIPGMPPIPHVGGPITLGSFTVLVGSMPQARASDMAVCVGPPSTVLMGAPTVLVGMGGGGGGGGPMGAAMGAAVSTGRSPQGDVPTAHRLPDGSWETRVGPLRIKGDPYFQAKVVRDLGLLRKTRSGRTMMRSLSRSGRTVTVVHDGGNGNFARALPGPAGEPRGFLQADGAPGEPADVLVGVDPDRTKLPARPGTAVAQAPWANPPHRPADVGLFHELIHADDFAHGRADGRPGANSGPRAGTPVPRAELRAVGLPPYEDSAYSENKYRTERGLAPRTFY